MTIPSELIEYQAAWVVVGTPHGILYGSFEGLDRAEEYALSLWELRGLACEVRPRRENSDEGDGCAVDPR